VAAKAQFSSEKAVVSLKSTLSLRQGGMATGGILDDIMVLGNGVQTVEAFKSRLCCSGSKESGG
jgi:hypothetical protein